MSKADERGSNGLYSGRIIDPNLLPLSFPKMISRLAPGFSRAPQSVWMDNVRLYQGRQRPRVLALDECEQRAGSRGSSLSSSEGNPEPSILCGITTFSRRGE